MGGDILSLYNFLLGAVGIIAMMMLVYGGFRYMTSAGNPAAMGDAKDIVYSAVVGLALALISWLIISTINPELLFTAQPTLSPVGSGSGFSSSLPPASCAYKSHGGYEEPNNCRCISDVDGKGGNTTCEISKSEEDWQGTCDELCKNKVCVSNPGCCIKADLRVGTDINDVSSKEVKINTEKDAEGVVFFDTLTYSYNLTFSVV